MELDQNIDMINELTNGPSSKSQGHTGAVKSIRSSKITGDFSSKELFSTTYSFDDVLDSLTPVDREIGLWGENYVLKYLKSELKNKYYDSEIIETEIGLEIKKNGELICDLKWLNSEFEASGRDIELYENGVEKLIEIKSTKRNKGVLKISRTQWNYMRHLGDNYYLYRVFWSGPEKAYIKRFQNPYRLIIEGKLELKTLRINL